MTSNTEELRAWVLDLGIEPPTFWEWRPTRAQIAVTIRTLPNTSAGPDDVPYKAWKALLRQGAWVADYFLEVLDGLSSVTQEEVPQGFNALLCHVLGKTPTGRSPDGSLRRTPADTRIIEVGTTENRILGRAVCFVLTRGPVGAWFDPDQYAWLPGRHALTAVTQMDTAMKIAALEGQDGPAGFGDLEKAFPSVLLDGLWALLLYLDAPLPLRTFLRNMYVDVQRYVRGKDAVYNWGSSRRGLKTGCGLSTVLLLFAMLVLGLALRRHLRLRDDNAVTVLFADDFAWTTRTWDGWQHLNTLFDKLQRVLGLTVNWAKTLAVCRSLPANQMLRAGLYRAGWQPHNFVRQGMHLVCCRGTLSLTKSGGKSLCGS